MTRPLLLLPALVLAAPPTKSYAPEAVPKLAVFPRSIALGGSGAIEVQIEMPPRSGTPALSAAVGSVGSLAQDGGLWVTRYKPPESIAPGYDVLLAKSATGAVGAATIELIAHATLPIRVIKPDSRVTVVVAGRTYGPVQAAGGSTVEVTVEVPPGVEEAEVTTEAPGVPSLHTKEPLTVPHLRRVFVLAPAVSRAGVKAEVIVLGVDDKGGLVRDPPRVELKGSGQVRSVSEVGPGVWKAEIYPGGGPLGVLARMGHSGSRATILAPWSTTPRPSLKPSPAVASMGTPLPTPSPAPAIPPAPTCDQLHLHGGGITTTARLREEIDDAARQPELVSRRNKLIELACLFPDEQSIRLQLSASWLLLGDNRAAIDAIQPVLDDEGEIHDDHRALALSYRASAELRLGELDQAIEDAKAAESLLPGLYSATYVLGEAEYLEKDFPAALAALLSAYKAAPDFAGAEDHAMLAEMLEAKGDLAEALVHRLDGAKLDANDPGGWRAAAHLAESIRSWGHAYEAWSILAASTIPGMPANSEAETGVARAAAAAPADPVISAVEGALAAERKDELSRAVLLAQGALDQEHENVAVRWHLARLLHRLGKDERAATEVDLLLDRTPHWVPALLLSGDVWSDRGDRTRASARYEDGSRQSSPLAPAARARLAILRAERK